MSERADVVSDELADGSQVTERYAGDGGLGAEHHKSGDGGVFPTNSRSPDASVASDAAPVDGASVSDETSVDERPDSGLVFEFVNLRVEEIRSDRARVRFDTTVATTCEVLWGLTERALNQTAIDPDMDPDNPYAFEHDVPLEDLPSGATIYFRAKGTTPDAEVQLSELRSFQTPEEVTDGMTSTADLINVAVLERGSIVTAVSSNYGSGANDATWGANHAFDGQMSTEWASNGDGDDAFIELDLGREFSLEVFGFRSRSMSDGSSIITHVTLRLDQETSLGPFDTPDPDERYLFQLPGGTRAQVVRVLVEGSTGGNTGAKEIELYAPLD